MEDHKHKIRQGVRFKNWVALYRVKYFLRRGTPLGPLPPATGHIQLDHAHPLLLLNRGLLMRNALLPRLRLGNLSQRHLPSPLFSRLGIHIVDIHKADLRTELVALPGLSANTEELVDLLERESLGFVDHEPNEDDADPAARVVSDKANWKELCGGGLTKKIPR